MFYSVNQRSLHLCSHLETGAGLRGERIQISCEMMLISVFHRSSFKKREKKEKNRNGKE